MLLHGIRILDVTRLLPSDYGSMLLGDMGAEVIKVEDPSGGDYMRWIPPVNKKESYLFLLTNRNKKSITLNLKEVEGRNIFLRLARTADVVFESFRPGVAKSLGIDYESIKAINPDVIYCSCTGYGQTGPYSDRPGHDINYLGVSGVLGVTGRHTGAPVIPGIPVADMTGGVFCALAICAALINRINSGEGQYIDISMTDCMVSYLSFHAAALFGKSDLAVDITGNNPYYRIYKTKDNKYISLGNVEDKFVTKFCNVIGRADLRKEHFESAEVRETVQNELQDQFQTKTLEEWLDLFERKDICYGRVNELAEIFADPQVEHRQIFFEIDHPVEGKIGQIALPIKFSNDAQIPRKAPPGFGEHTEDVLKQHGYSKDEIAVFKQLRVIG